MYIDTHHKNDVNFPFLLSPPFILKLPRLFLKSNTLIRRSIPSTFNMHSILNDYNHLTMYVDFNSIFLYSIYEIVCSS